jgi:hypothetical protein
MGGGQTFNFGFPHTDVFHYIGPYSAAPNTKQPAQTITNVATIKQNVKVIFIACGGDDGLIGNSENYHEFLDQNAVPNIYQIEPGQGHTKTVWNRSLYNFAQRIFVDVGPGGGGSGSGGSSGNGSGGAAAGGAANGGAANGGAANGGGDGGVTSAAGTSSSTGGGTSSTAGSGVTAGSAPVGAGGSSTGTGMGGASNPGTGSPTGPSAGDSGSCSFHGALGGSSGASLALLGLLALRRRRAAAPSA